MCSRRSNWALDPPNWSETADVVVLVKRSPLPATEIPNTSARTAFSAPETLPIVCSIDLRTPAWSAPDPVFHNALRSERTSTMRFARSRRRAALIAVAPAAADFTVPASRPKADNKPVLPSASVIVPPLRDPVSSTD